MLDRWERPLLWSLILLDLFLKSLFVGGHDLAHDEPFTVLQAHRDLPALFKILPEENNPPLHFLFVHFWVKLVPLDAAWLRAPSAVFSALVIWPLFMLARTLANTRTAFLAAALYIFSNYHLGFAHEVRAYALFTLLAVFSMWVIIGISRKYFWILLALVDMLMVYTHFFGWLMIGVQLLCVILIHEWHQYAWKVIKAHLVVILSYVPYGHIFIARFSTSVEGGTWLEPPNAEEIYNMIWRWSNAPVLAVLFLTLILFHLVRTRPLPLLSKLGMLWALVPLIGMFLVSYIAPMYLDRYLVYAAPGFLLLVAQAVPISDNKRISWILPAMLVLAMGATYRPWKTEWPEPGKVVAAAEASRRNDARPVLIHPYWFSHAYAWHLDRDLLRHPAELEKELIQRGVVPIHTLEALADVQAERSILICSGDDPIEEQVVQQGWTVMDRSWPDRKTVILELAR